jgi:ribulose-5-phosphate 4-epimerase/fuculose-1-phosphate aldolase
MPGILLRPDPLLAAIRERQACLLSGWGLLTCGSSLPAATQRAAEIEALAQIWWQLLQLAPHRQAPLAAR